MPDKSLKRLLAVAVGGSVVAYVVFVTSFFPNAHGKLGHDYEYFLPLLLAGKYWIAENSLFAVPRFSPAFCGGLPLLANPQSIFYSVPQALSLLTDPVTSFLVTTLIFAGVGACSTFALLYRRFRVSAAAASLGAVIFLFNGFLAYRMVIGHVTYHVIGLLPLLCYWLLTPRKPGASGLESLRRDVGPIAGAAGILAYFVYAGALNIVVPIGITCVIVGLLHTLMDKPDNSFWMTGAAAAVVAAAASAAKLAPAIAWLVQFPRPNGLHIFDNAADLFSDLSIGLFLPSLLTNQPARHELEYGVGLVPLVLILVGACVAAERSGRAGRWRRIGAARGARLAALALLLLLPLWLNYGGAEKAAWLKTLPYIGSNVILIRWFLIYQLPLMIGAACLLDFIFASTRERLIVALIGILVTVVPTLAAPRAFYDGQPYDPAGILAADRTLDVAGQPPPITGIGRQSMDARNDGLTSGQSSYPCYEPIFGYGLQTFPPGLQEGKLATAAGGGRHLRNPACYLYGPANGCAPGDTFSSAQHQDEASFAAYGRFAYGVPLWQSWADRLSLVGLVAILAGFALALRRRWLERTVRRLAPQ